MKENKQNDQNGLSGTNKLLLAKLMKMCIPEYQKCDVNDIANQYIIGDVKLPNNSISPGKEHHEIYDIRFQTKVPNTDSELLINVKWQNDFSYDLIDEGLAHCYEMMEAQSAKVLRNHSEPPKKAYSLWLCLNAEPKLSNTMRSFSIENTVLGPAMKDFQDVMKVTIIWINGLDKLPLMT